MVPDLRRLPPGERYVPFDVSETHVGIDEYDVANQGLISHHYTSRLNSVPFRYVWPAELDLMARIAGLTLRERWADWDRSPFTSESRKHVSVWQPTSGASLPYPTLVESETLSRWRLPRSVLEAQLEDFGVGPHARHRGLRMTPSGPAASHASRAARLVLG